MKTMSKKFVVSNIGRLCSNYRSSLRYVVTHNESIKRYIDNRIVYAEPEGKSRFVQLLSKKVDWIETLLKMDPVAYSKKRMVHSSELLSRHLAQVVFADKIIPLIERLDFNNQTVIDKQVSNYGMFLTLCLKNPNNHIVPNLIEDFVWHSHMSDHWAYASMTKAMFGHILPHRTDIDLEKANVETKAIRKNFMLMNSHTTGTMTSVGTLGIIASVAALSNSNNGQQDGKKPSDSGCSGISDCAGINLIGFGPSGILNPINPWNNVNPMSPYYSSYHETHTSNNFSDTYSSSDSSSNDSSSNDSSSDCGGCGSGGCGD